MARRSEDDSDEEEKSSSEEEGGGAKQKDRISPAFASKHKRSKHSKKKSKKKSKKSSGKSSSRKKRRNRSRSRSRTRERVHSGTKSSRRAEEGSSDSSVAGPLTTKSEITCSSEPNAEEQPIGVKQLAEVLSCVESKQSSNQSTVTPDLPSSGGLVQETLHKDKSILISQNWSKERNGESDIVEQSRTCTENTAPNSYDQKGSIPKDMSKDESLPQGRIRSKRRSKSKERSRSRERSRSKERSRLKEKSKAKEKSKSRERSSSEKKSKSKGRSSSKERSRSKKRSSPKKKSRSKERTRKEERSRSKERSKERSKKRERSRSRERSRPKDRSKSRKQGRSKDRSRERSRERSKSGGRSGERSELSKKSRQSQERSYSRRRSREHYRSQSRERNRYKEHNRRHRSRSFGRRSRSRSFNKSRRSRSYDKRYRSRSRSPYRSSRHSYYSRHSKMSRSRSRSRSEAPVAASVPVNLTIALGVSTTTVTTSVSNTDKPAAVSETKSIADFTALCKKLTEIDDSDEEPVKSVEEEVSHPFQVKPAKDIVIPPVIIPIPLPKSTEPDKPLEQAFPVSSGNQHKTKEDCKDSTIVEGVDGSVAAAEEVFQTTSQQEKLDVSGLIAKRLEAQNRLLSNPNDYEAKLILEEVQMKIQNWASVNLKPGQFTGESLVQSMLPKESINSGYQAWAKKDMFHNLAPIRGGVGMRLLEKMGWKPGQVLGKRGEGNIEPIAMNVKMDRKGLTSCEETGKGGKGGGKNIMASHGVEGKHPVSALAEFCSKKRWQQPAYNIVHESGPSHKKNFLYQVIVNGCSYQYNIVSNNKKLAKAQAAFAALKALGLVSQHATM